MALYLRSKRLDQETGDSLEVILNSKDATEVGINHGDIISLSYGEVYLYVTAEITDSMVNAGTVGLYEEVWTKHEIPSDETVVIDVIDRPKSIDYIKKKLLGEKLSEKELAEIMKDISLRKIREVEIAYFMASFFNPGFDDEEVLGMIKGMAYSGDILNFDTVQGEKIPVVDKHSIGGVAAKGVTPILVPTIAAFGLTIPNTSTRAITTPAGTSDILEVAMPVTIDNDDIMEVVKETGACMIWGGALKLAPADDVLIHVERGLHVQSYQKLLVSIIAKKIAMGISHILIDLPFGPGTKIEDPDDVELLEHSFKNLFSKVGITCETYPRRVVAPDGRGVGPMLEMRDILMVLEQHEDRPKDLEELAADMAGKLLEEVGYADPEKGKQMALDKIKSGETLKKFWEIADAQGAKQHITSADIKTGEYKLELKATNSGRLEVINNKSVVRVARALGNPFIKEAGIYFNKGVGDIIREGDVLLTLYATSKERLEKGENAYDESVMFDLRG